jgi:hypothetical protein
LILKAATAHRQAVALYPRPIRLMPVLTASQLKYKAASADLWMPKTIKLERKERCWSRTGNSPPSESRWLLSLLSCIASTFSADIVEKFKVLEGHTEFEEELAGSENEDTAD